MAQALKHVSKTLIWLIIAPVIIRTLTSEYKIYTLFDEVSTITLMDVTFASTIGLKGEETFLKLSWTYKNT